MDYDQLIHLLRSRRSIRKFLDLPVPREAIEKLIEAARWAPSAGNRQAWRMLVVTSPDTIDAMAEAVRAQTERLVAEARPETSTELRGYLENFSVFAAAPVVIGAIHRRGLDLLRESSSLAPVEQQGPPRAMRDSLSSVSAAIMSMLLAAQTLGLGACWMTGPLVATSALSQCLSVPEGWELAALIPVGYPAHQPAPPPRRPVGRLCKYL